MSNSIHLVCASGGLEQPSFTVFAKESDALDYYRHSCQSLISAPGDRVDLLRINVDQETVATIKSTTHDDDDD